MASYKVLSRQLRHGRRPPKLRQRTSNGRFQDKAPVYYSSNSNNKRQTFVKIGPVKSVSSSKRTRPSNVSSKVSSKIPSSTNPAKRPRLINLIQVQNSSIGNTLQKQNRQSPAKTLPEQKRPISSNSNSNMTEPVSTTILLKNQNRHATTKQRTGLRNSKRISFLEGIKGPVVRVNRASRQALDLCQEGNMKVAQTDSLRKMLCLLSFGLMPNTNSTKIQPPFVVLQRLPQNRVKNFKLWQESWINSKKMRNNKVKATVSVAGARRSLRNNVAPACFVSDNDQKSDPLRLGNNMTARQYQVGHTDKQTTIASCLRRRPSYNNNNIENEPNRVIPVRKVAETIATRCGAKLICVPRKSTERIKSEQDPSRIVPTFSIVTKVKKKNTNIVCIDLTDDEPHDNTYIKGVRSRLSNCDTTIHIICS